MTFSEIKKIFYTVNFEPSFFMLKCDKLTYRRNRVLIERTGGTTDKEILGGLLFKDDFYKETKEMLVDLWKEREILIMISDLGAG